MTHPDRQTRGGSTCFTLWYAGWCYWPAIPQYELMLLFQPGGAICGHMGTLALFSVGALSILVMGTCTMTGGVEVVWLVLETCRFEKGTTTELLALVTPVVEEPFGLGQLVLAPVPLLPVL